MANVFFCPKLGTRFDGIKKEQKIRLLAQQNAEKCAKIQPKDILAVIFWIDSEINGYQHAREKIDRNIRHYVTKRKELLSLSSVRTVIKENLFISDIGLTARVRSELCKAGIDTVSELCALSEEQILDLRRIGQRGLAEIKERLSDYGLSLKGLSADPRNARGETDESLSESDIEEALARKFDELFGSFSDDEDEDE